MFQRVIRCPIAFFDVNPAGKIFIGLNNSILTGSLHSSGRILNRFTKDISVIDENIPVSLFDYLQVGLLSQHFSAR